MHRFLTSLCAGALLSISVGLGAPHAADDSEATAAPSSGGAKTAQPPSLRLAPSAVSRFELGIVYLGSNGTEVADRLQHLFELRGFQNRYSGGNILVLPAPRAWFSTAPTVLHYAQATTGPAKDLADALSEEFGVRFRVQRGAGFGVSKAQRAHTLIVHYPDR